MCWQSEENFIEDTLSLPDFVGKRHAYFVKQLLCQSQWLHVLAATHVVLPCIPICCTFNFGEDVCECICYSPSPKLNAGGRDFDS